MHDHTVAAGPVADPRATTWVTGADGSGWPLQNLPYGSCSVHGGEPWLGVRIGDHVLPLPAAAAAGAFDGTTAPTRAAIDAPDLGPLLAAGRAAWSELRTRLGELLVTGSPDEAALAPVLVPVGSVQLHLPFPVADFVDFYSSIEHATNLGHMFRPGGDALFPNWRHLPVGYHGRAGTVVVTGSAVDRPSGQRLGEDGSPTFGPTEKLDMELEVGFVLGGSTTMGTPVPTSQAREHVFGVVLVNDWSARDVQAWEYVPLGPFLGKSFATSISGWVVPIDALEPFRCPGPRQRPPVLPYLQTAEPWAFGIDLSATLRPLHATTATTVTDVGFDHVYWSVAQQLAHLTVNGARVRPGDLLASGTVSGATRRERGSLIELSWNGEDPLELDDGGTRSFLADGDEVVLSGSCTVEGHPTIRLGEVRGHIR